MKPTKTTTTKRTKTAPRRTGGAIYRQEDRSKNWIIKYQVNGAPKIEATGTDDYATAEAMLTDRLAAIKKNIPIAAAVGKVRWETAVADLVTDYKINKRDSLSDAKRRIDLHLTPVFAGQHLSSITPKEIKDYIAARLECTYIPGTGTRPDGRKVVGTGKPRRYSNAEINREIAALKRIFTIQMQLGTLAYRPHMPKLSEAGNVRRGFFSKDDHDAVLPHLAPVLADLMSLAYLTAWRCADELMTLEWSDVHFDEHEIRINRGDDKNEEGRVFPITDDIRAILMRRKADRDAARKAGHLVPWVFFRRYMEPATVKPMKNWRKAFLSAVKKASIGKRMIHDFRRTGARNMVRLNVPERVVLSLGGWKTRSVMERYNIVNKSDSDSARASLAGQLADRSAILSEAEAG